MTKPETDAEFLKRMKAKGDLRAFGECGWVQQRTLTMTDIHIPAEVVEAAAKKYYTVLAEACGFELKWEDLSASRKTEKIIISRAALRAALSAWVATGMAKTDQYADYNGDWIAVVPEASNAFPVLIIKTTEAT